MADPNLIGGGRLTRAEVSGDRRQFQASNLSRGALLARFWRYLGKNRGLILLALVLSVSSSLLALYGPKLSGQAINAIAAGEGKVDFRALLIKLHALGYDSHVTNEREIEGDQQLEDVLYVRNYLKDIIEYVYGEGSVFGIRKSVPV